MQKPTEVKVCILPKPWLTAAGPCPQRTCFPGLFFFFFCGPWHGLRRSKMPSLTHLPSARWMLRKDLKSTFLTGSFSKVRCFVFKAKNKRKTKRSPHPKKKKTAWERLVESKLLCFWSSHFIDWIGLVIFFLHDQRLHVALSWIHWFECEHSPNLIFPLKVALQSLAFVGPFLSNTCHCLGLWQSLLPSLPFSSLF